MSQLNIMAEWDRLKRLSAIGDPLERINSVIDWEAFRPTLENAYRNEPKGLGGRPPIDRVLMFKISMLQQWYNVSDDAAEYVINDRLSFQRFLGMSLSDKVPDAKTIWAFKEHLKNSGVYRELFDLFNRQMEKEGIITRAGSLIDASFVDVPRQRNTREENKIIKEGGIPMDWLDTGKVNMFEQKDVDARWTKKNEETHYGYKDHVKVDRDSKIIVAFEVTAANVHDSNCFEKLIDKYDKAVWADSAYVGEAIKASILEKFLDLEMHINEKGNRNRPLTNEQKEKNREKSTIRARVEHVFGYMTVSMRGMFLRCIGIERATRDIALKNLGYNMRRLECLVRLGKAPFIASNQGDCLPISG